MLAWFPVFDSWRCNPDFGDVARQHLDGCFGGLHVVEGEEKRPQEAVEDKNTNPNPGINSG
jgi:hypothetical protein